MLDLPTPLPHAVCLDQLGYGDERLPFDLLRQGKEQGLQGALVTLVNIEGGAPRAIGTHMAVLEDGRYVGYISGGCLEGAVATEAMRIIRTGVDETLRFGMGSRFLDVQLPCGGGVDLHITARPDHPMVEEALDLFSARQSFALALGADGAHVLNGTAPQTGWGEDGFYRRYDPPVRLLLVGAGAEMVALSRLGLAAGMGVTGLSADEACLAALAQGGAAAQPLHGDTLPAGLADAHTALVFLFHDHARELPLLKAGLDSPAFYIGALGSRRTQVARRENLTAAGMAPQQIDRIHGPIGLFGPTRNAHSLAVAILAEIASCREGVAA